MSRQLLRQVTRLWIATFLLVGMVALSGQTPAPAKTERLFWKVTSPTTEVYFLGSIHVATKDMYPLPPEIEAAFKQSANLVVEADVTAAADQTAMAMKVLQQGTYPEGDSLAKHISPETMKKFGLFCDANHISTALFATMKPPLAAMMIEVMVMQTMGLSADDGIDKHFLDAAHAAKDKKIVELESADAQFKLLFGIEDKIAEKWLLESIKDNGKDELQKLVKAWNDGDVKTVESMSLETDKNDPDEQKLADLMIYKRNDEMTK